MDISRAHQDYLKAIYLLQSREQGANTSAIAQALEVSPASATGMVKRLAEAGYLEHTPYQGVRLTPAGEQVALQMVRHHRLIELFLHDLLDIPWDRVHGEAERLEHAMSEEVIEAIARKLGYPSVDPHGDPIPDRDGSLAEAGADISLVRLDTGQPARLARVHLQDGDRLRYLGRLGLYPGAAVRIVKREPFEGPLTVEVGGQAHVLAYALARLLSVTPTQAANHLTESLNTPGDHLSAAGGLHG
jgi:DtxR family Mn-dependent transcriptional regulator